MCAKKGGFMDNTIQQEAQKRIQEMELCNKPLWIVIREIEDDSTLAPFKRRQLIQKVEEMYEER